MSETTSRVYPGMVHLNGNMLAAVDVETTGREAGLHEIIQIAVVPLDHHLQPMADVRPFYQNIKPDYPERSQKEAQTIHGIDLQELALTAPDKWQVAEWFDEWWQKLKLPFRKTLVPLAQNWQFEAGFLKAWLGVDSFNQFFHPYARDTMLTAIHYNDKAVVHGLPPVFKLVGLPFLCKYFGVVNTNPHDALSDAVAEAAVYKKLLEMDLA